MHKTRHASEQIASKQHQVDVGVAQETAPELKRTLGSFQVFAVSFAFISVAVGVFGT